MRVVENSELSNYKVLPFDLFTENKTKILEAGEVLTPGKLIMLKNYAKVYAEDFHREKVEQEDFSEKNVSRMKNFTFESLDADDFETVVNRDSCLNDETQIKIKYFYKKIFDLFLNGYSDDAVLKLQSLVNILKNEVYKQMYKYGKGSQIRFMGEYELCHPLNVAIVSGLIARKLEYQPRNADELILAALLHDIGKLKVDTHGESPFLVINEDEMKEHPIIGYKMIKEFGLSEDIAKAVLEHHENNDGSGYPRGLSNDFICEYGQIINVANYYDNLAFNRTHVPINNNKEALREMLEVGTGRFSAKMLYTFIHMFSYDDMKDFNDMMF